MKYTKVYITVLLLASVLVVNAQKKKTEAKTEEFFIDMTEEIFLDLSEAEVDLKWEFPATDGESVQNKEQSILVGIKSDAEIKDVKLYLNGVEVVSRGFTVRGRPTRNYSKVYEHDIQLSEGGNVLKLTVTNTKGQQKTVERTVILEAEVVANRLDRKDYAVLFATDEYQDWGDLTNPINDAETIAEELEQMYGFDVELVKNPTQSEVILKLREYAKKSYMEHDQLMIFFAGHGQFDELMGQGYIVTTESQKNDPAKTTYLSHAVLRNVIDNIPSEHTLLVMDVCFGGTFDPAIARADSRGEDNMYSEVSSIDYIKRKLRFKTRKYITSGGKQYVPDGRPGFHSPFASKFIEALRSYGGRDEIITLSELFGWLERINPEPKAGGFGVDAPGSDFVFVAQQN
jgi:hypothetical protein